MSKGVAVTVILTIIMGVIALNLTNNSISRQRSFSEGNQLSYVQTITDVIAEQNDEKALLQIKNVLVSKPHTATDGSNYLVIGDTLRLNTANQFLTYSDNYKATAFFKEYTEIYGSYGFDEYLVAISDNRVYSIKGMKHTKGEYIILGREETLWVQVE